MEFKVTPSELDALASGLSGLLGELAQAGSVSSMSAGAAENAQLETAIEAFVSRWAHGIQELHTGLAALSDRLSGAGAGYEKAERAISGGFGGTS
jgi:uncharacterized protein YukE